MKVNHYLYPHPVLGIGDDYRKNPLVSRNISYDDNKKEILFNYKVTDLSFDFFDLLKSEKIALICEINCSYTLYRKVFSTYENELIFEIPDQDLKNKVELQLMLIATKNIQNFASPNFSNELRDQSFLIEMGDVLGVLDTTVLDIDAAGLVVSDFVKISENTVDEILRYEFDQDALIIKLPSKQLKALQLLKNNPDHENILISTLIIPILIHASHFLSEENDESCSDKPWYRALQEKSQDILGTPYPSDPSDINSLIERILENPNERLFMELEKLSK
jgi:hypothetical protein